MATRACELTDWKDPWNIDTLAAASAEAGKFDDAVRWQMKALESPESLGTELERGKERLKLYEVGRAYHEPKPEPASKVKDESARR